jgi:hypothetical protein
VTLKKPALPDNSFQRKGAKAQRRKGAKAQRRKGVKKGVKKVLAIRIDCRNSVDKADVTCYLPEATIITGSIPVNFSEKVNSNPGVNA